MINVADYEQGFRDGYAGKNYSGKIQLLGY